MNTQGSTTKEALKACRGAFGFAALFSLFVNLLMLTVPIYMLQVFDRVLTSRSQDTLIFLTLIAIGALAAFGLLDIARSRILVHIGTWLDQKLSPKALALSADDVLRGGQYAPQSLRDITNLRQFVGSTAIFSLFDAPWTPLYLIVIFLFHVWLGVIATVGAIVLFMLALLNELMTNEPLAKANSAFINNQQQFDSALRNAEAIQAMGMLPAIIQRWSVSNNIILKLQAVASRRSGLVLSISKFIRMTLQLSILGWGAYFVITDQITPGAMIAASIITARALAPIEQIIGTWKQFIGARSSYHRLEEYLAQDLCRGESIELPKPQGLVTVENLSYLAPGTNRAVLQGINFAIAPGEILAIVGPSGAGKSTLARLMLGIWKPISGTARLDGADVFTWNRSQFGQVVGYLPQDVDLFSGSIRDNIARLTETTDDKIIKAAQLAGAHQLILHMPDGYDTNLDGYALSGGQRQRIALARAFYGDPSLIVLDEPNSSLDNDGDIALIRAIAAAKNNKQTVVVISHRPNLVQLADRILVLQEGKMEMLGPRDDVLNQLKANAQQQAAAQNSTTTRPEDHA